MDRTSRQMNRTLNLGKWIVHQVNGSYIMEMDRTSGKGTYITQMSRTSREVDRTRKCIVRKSIVPDGKELGQQSKAQARLPSTNFLEIARLIPLKHKIFV